MIDFLILIGIYIVSVIAAILSNRRSSGIDWYRPIGKYEKFIMFVVNAFVFIINIMILIIAQINDIKHLMIVVSLIMLFLIVTILRNALTKANLNSDNFKKFMKMFWKSIFNRFTDKSESDKITIIDLSTRFFTVFVSVLDILSLVYLLIRPITFGVPLLSYQMNAAIKDLFNDNILLLINNKMLSLNKSLIAAFI